MSLREELIENGIDPDQTNDLGYICAKCDYEPTNYEVHMGARCKHCRGDKQLENAQ